jgi:pimeloyl-ACP methyl ester carboxylesterase
LVERSGIKASILHGVFVWASPEVRAISSFEKRTINVEGMSTGYLTAGAGPPLLLLHGVGTSAREWSWVLPGLARNHLVYAIDLPGYDGSVKPPDYAPAFTASFISSFLDAVGVERAAAVVGNSFGGLTALHLALSEPSRVSALILSDSAGLGRAVSPALAAVTPPGGGDVAKILDKTPLGAGQRAFSRALLLFARPWQIPPKWLKDQYQLAQTPNFMEATLESIRSAVSIAGQREVLLDRLPELQMPTLIVWGIEDRVIPYWHATAAVIRLEQGDIEFIAYCGHLPHVEQPKRFVSILDEFLGDP